MSTPLQSPLNPQTQCLSTESLLSYADGRLEGKAAHLVERHLAGCPLCADALEGIEMIGTAAFKALLAEENAQPLAQKPAQKGRVINFTRIAAAITSVAAVILVVMMVLPTSPAGIAADYYSTPEGQSLRGGSRGNPESPTAPTVKSPVASTPDINALMARYNDQKFEEAAAGLSQINSSEAQFFAGAAYIEIQQYDKAILSFQRVVELNDSFVMDAKWNLGLAHLFKGDKTAAIKVMSEIASDENNDYFVKAKEILKKLE